MAKSKPKKMKQEDSKTSKHKKDLVKKPCYVVLEEKNPIVCVPEKKAKEIPKEKDNYTKIKDFLVKYCPKMSSWAIGYKLEKLHKKNKVKTAIYTQDFLDFLTTLKAKNAVDILENELYFDAIFNIIDQKEYFVRDLNTWKRKSRNTDKQFLDIIKHLFVKYKIPACLLNLWTIRIYNETDKTKKYISYFFALTNGVSVRSLADFPVKITPKLAHYFMQSPDYLEVDGAIRYAQVLAHGGDEYLAWFVNQSYLGRNNFIHEGFWDTVIAFFARQTMFDAEKLPELVDYLENEYGNNPNFSMKGRTLNALIRQSDEWHLRIREERASKNVPLKNIIWENSFIKPFERVEGNIETTNHKIYTIKELLNSNELSKEGKEMGHCVGSYAQKCVKRNTAIFAFGTRNYWELKTERLVTIEINLQTMEIVQAKGKYNRNTTEKERQIIGYWLDENNLEKSRWINW